MFVLLEPLCPRIVCCHLPSEPFGQHDSLAPMQLIQEIKRKTKKELVQAVKQPEDGFRFHSDPLHVRPLGRKAGSSDGSPIFMYPTLY